MASPELAQLYAAAQQQNNLIAELQREVRRLHGANAGAATELKRQQQNLTDLQAALDRVQVNYRSGDPHIQRIENVPGRRIPFDLLADIAISGTATGTQEGSITIDQDGPFVAVARMATFISAASFVVTGEGGAQARFQARSFGRYRPIHSAWDLGDGHPFTQLAMPLAFPGTGGPYMASPSNQSPFRSMQGDFRIQCIYGGASYPRGNIEVPSPFWSRAINEPWELAALDVYERGNTITFRVLPQHPANPGYGNIQRFSVGNPIYPSISSQYDCVEGIDDQVLPAPTVDPVTRVFDGVLTIGFHGYKILQPPGPGPY